MNPLAVAGLVLAGGVGVALATRKRNTAAAMVNEYWTRVRAGESRTAILREWAIESDPYIADAELDRILDPAFIFARADFLVATASGMERTEWGLDIFAPEGSTVRAAKTGIVSLVTGTLAGSCGKGNYVGLSHLSIEGEATFYSNLQYIDVGIGQIVRGGEAIGRVGRTTFCADGRPHARGELARPQLHFEFHASRIPTFAAPSPMNALTWLSYQEVAPYGGLT